MARRARRIVRWALRVVLGAIALVVVAVIATLVVVHTDWGRDLVRARIEAALAAKFPGGVHIGKLEGSVFGELVVEDVELDGKDHKPIVKIGETRVRVSLLPLVHHTARVDQIVVDDVAIVIPESSEDKPAESGEPGEPSPWSIELPDVAVHRARVTKGAETVDNIELVARARGAISGRLDALVGVHATWRGHALSAGVLASYEDGVASVPLAGFAGDDARVGAFGVRITKEHTLEGAVGGFVPADLARAFGANVPGDATFAFGALPGGVGDLHATLGASEVRAFVQVDPAQLHARGVLILDDPKLGVIVWSGVASPARLRGVVSANIEGGKVIAAVDGTIGGGGWVVAGGRRGAVRGTVFAHAKRQGDDWMLDKAHLLADASELGGARGAFRVDVKATGRAWPEPKLRVDGIVDGAGVRYDAFGVRDVHVAIADLRDVPAHPVGEVSFKLTDATRNGAPLGSASIAARAELDAKRTFTLDLGDQQIIAAATGTTWTGKGGRLVVDEHRVELRKLHVAGAAGALDVDARVAKPSGDLAVTVAAKDVTLAALAPQLAGIASGTVSLARRGGTWSGDAQVHGRGLVAAGKTFDGDAEVKIDGRRVELRASGAAPWASATIAANIEAPRELSDAAAWRALDRRALHDVTLTIGKLDLAELGRTGSVEGELAITATGARGTLHVRGVHTPHSGDLAADLSLAPGATPGEIAATVVARLADTATAVTVAELALPARIADPAAYRALGRDALRSAKVTVDELAFDPAVLARLGAHGAPYRGRASATIEVAQGASRVTAAADVRELRGGALVQPIDVGVRGAIDPRGANATISASRAVGARSEPGEQLLNITALSPIALESLGDGTLAHAPLSGTLELPTLEARDVLALFGRSDVTAGTIGGQVELAGTIGTPIAHATFTGKNITVPAKLADRKPAVLRDLAIEARWGGADGELTVRGEEAGGGTLTLVASGRPDEPATVLASLVAKHFDLEPLATFAPGPLVAASGTLDASVEAHGLDPDKGELHGELHLRGGRVPLSSAVGTLRKANLDVTIANHAIDAKFTGKLGGGDVNATAKVTLDGASPKHADTTIALRKIAPIGAIEPVVSADITGHFDHGAKRWTGDISIMHAAIAIPSQQKHALLASGAPPDMTFADEPPPLPKQWHRPAPADPFLVAGITLGETTIDAEDLKDVVTMHVVVTGALKLSVAADGFGLDGSIDHQRGGVELLGREYQVDHAHVAFDGSLDPELDVRVLHDFPDVTLVADVAGRVDALDLALSSDPSMYTQDQLLGFFLGGEPGGDPSSASRDAAAGASASFLSSKIGTRIKRVLPVKLDVLTYEAGTSTTSGAVRAGIWLGRKLFVQYKGHPEARPDENTNEANFEYYLPHNWFVQWTIGDRDIDGADILHRWRW